MVVSAWGKQSARTGVGETVLLRDPQLIQIIVKWQEAGKDFLSNEPSYAFNQFYREAVEYFVVAHRKPTPHGVRRGGAA